MRKKVSVIWLIPLLVSYLYIIVIYYVKIPKINIGKKIESNSYKDIEAYSRNYNVDYDINGINIDVKDYITNIDNILLNSLNVEDSLNLTSDEKIEIVLNYIAKNEHLYKDRIVDLKEQFIYVDNDTNYYSIGYIDKKDLISIMEMFFETDNIDLSTSKFYDSNSSFVAIVPTIKDEIIYKDIQIYEKHLDENNTLHLSIKYIREVYGKQNEIKVSYLISTHNGKYYIRGYKIIESIVY